MRNPTVTLHVGTKIFSGWVSVNINRSIEEVAGSFQLTFSSSRYISSGEIAVGSACHIEVDGIRVITGYIDDFTVTLSGKNYLLTIAGRDKSADLIDSAAIYRSGRWRNVPLAKIAADLCEPFGIEVIWDVDDSCASAPFKWMQIEPGETVFEILARAARQRGILMTSDTYGNLLFTTASSRIITNLTMGDDREPVITRIDMCHSWRDRFSLYRTIGDSAAGTNWGETQSPLQSTAIFADVNDDAITRYRPTVILSDDNLTNETAKVRAEWKKRRATAHSQPIMVEVHGWFYDDINLWLPNNLLKLTINADYQIDKTLLIVGVAFSLNEEGIITRLQLMQPDGFLAPNGIREG
ncbi:contractile injection system protein, VgrG/Pvc8 family [Orbaceae bacterium ESL0721]|nr:contractile injection system protein, VgrG/Pvc8 family [Orbaceae bacterium ESL0721]